VIKGANVAPSIPYQKLESIPPNTKKIKNEKSKEKNEGKKPKEKKPN